MPETALVTGGCGFIGSHLVDRLVGLDYRVRVLDNLTPQVHPAGEPPDYQNPGAEYLVGDVLDEKTLVAALAEVDLVVHFAAAVGVGQSMYQPAHYVRTNSLGTASLLQLLVDADSRPRKLLVASSMSVYGEGSFSCPGCGPVAADRDPQALEAADWDPSCPTCSRTLKPLPTAESKSLEPASVYAQTKLDQEVLSLSIGRAYDLPTVALRFFNVYGPRQSLSNPYTGVAAIFSSRLRSGQRPVVYEDGRQMRDFVHVDDVVSACVLALTEPEADCRVLNVGSGSPISIGELARLLIKIHGLEGRTEPELPGTYRAGDIRHCFADVSAIERIGYRPQVALEDGLGELVRWSETARRADHFDQAQAELRRRGLA